MAMDSIFGQMAACTKATLSMESDMDMEFGMTKMKLSVTQDVIGWIKNKDLGCISGLESKHTKDSLEKIIVKAMVDFINYPLNFHLNPLRTVEYSMNELYSKECGPKGSKNLIWQLTSPQSRN